MEKSKTLIMVPVFNAEKFIMRTLRSCVNQTRYSEVWVVDNCSTDNTIERVKELSALHDNLKLVKNERNLGRVGNWNRCLELFADSDFEYLKFVFSGDEISPYCVEEGEKAFSLDMEIGAVAFPYEFVHADGSVSISRHDECPNRIFTAKEITKKNLADGMLLGAIICNIYAKQAIGNFRFNENEISKARFDIRVLEEHKAFYLDKVLARFNVDAHNTFSSADSMPIFMEFSYIESSEYQRISQGNLFTDVENKDIEQSIISNCIERMCKFMRYSTAKKALRSILKVALPNNQESLVLRQLNFENILSYDEAMTGFVYQPLPWVGLNKAEIRGEATVARWLAIRSHFDSHASMKDIGSCLGYFCFKAAEEYNMHAIGIDMNSTYIKIASGIKKHVPNFEKVFFQEMALDEATIHFVPQTEITILFSIWHHWVYHYGLSVATKLLATVWSKTDKILFFETGEGEIKDEFRIPFEGDVKEWIFNYLKNTLPNSEISIVGEFDAGNYSHYKMKIRRSVFKVQKK